MKRVITDPNEVQPVAVNVVTAAKMLGLTPWQVRKLIQDGKLRARTTGKSYIIALSAIEEFLAGSDEPMRHQESA